MEKNLVTESEIYLQTFKRFKDHSNDFNPNLIDVAVKEGRLKIVYKGQSKKESKKS